MVTRTIEIEPESELGRALQSASARGEQVVLAVGRDSYQLDVGTKSARSRDDKPTLERVAGVRAAIDAAAGAWKDFDAEAFKEYLRERRRTANRPSIRL